VRIKALSLSNGYAAPWASWIREGRKTIETRMWGTGYRGPVLICAAKRPNGPMAGCAVCIVDLLGCRWMRRSDEALALCDWELGRFAWVLANVRHVLPFHVRGRLGLFGVDVPDELVRAAPSVPTAFPLLDLGGGS